MRKEDKNTVIEQIAATTKEYSHFYLVDTTAMNAASTSALRRKCFESDIKLLVVKNTLLQKALDSLEVDYSPLYGSLKGSTTVMFCNTGNGPAKLIKSVAKDGIPGLKAAYVEKGDLQIIDSLVSDNSRWRKQVKKCKRRTKQEEQIGARLDGGLWRGGEHIGAAGID